MEALRAPCRSMGTVGHWSNDLYGWCEENKVKVTRSPPGDGLVCLKYDIGADQRDPLVRHCRGLVLDERTLEVMCRPYDKFHNLGEAGAADVDWRTAVALEKLDGTMVSLWLDRRPVIPRWRVSTLGHPTAGGSYNGAGETFEQAFMRTWTKLGYRLPAIGSRPQRDVWYFFEFCAPDNRIVVRYQMPRIVLHGARRAGDHAELSRIQLTYEAEDNGWELVRAEQVTRPGDVLEMAMTLDPLKGEGFVVLDGDFNRVKVKSARYVELHQMKEERTPRRLLEVVKRGQSEVDEMVAYFPEYRADFESVQRAWGRVEAAIARVYSHWHRESGDFSLRKDFALRVKDKVGSAILFRLFSDGVPDGDGLRDEIRSRMMSLRTDALLSLLELSGQLPSEEAA
jgi:hypothetical protein